MEISREEQRREFQHNQRLKEKSRIMSTRELEESGRGNTPCPIRRNRSRGSRRPVRTRNANRQEIDSKDLLALQTKLEDERRCLEINREEQRREFQYNQEMKKNTGKLSASVLENSGRDNAPCPIRSSRRRGSRSPVRTRREKNLSL